MKTLYQKLINEKSDYDRFKNFNEEIHSFIVFFGVFQANSFTTKLSLEEKKRKIKIKSYL